MTDFPSLPADGTTATSASSTSAKSRPPTCPRRCGPDHARPPLRHPRPDRPGAGAGPRPRRRPSWSPGRTSSRRSACTDERGADGKAGPARRHRHRYGGDGQKARSAGTVHPRTREGRKAAAYRARRGSRQPAPRPLPQAAPRPWPTQSRDRGGHREGTAAGAPGRRQGCRGSTAQRRGRRRRRGPIVLSGNPCVDALRLRTASATSAAIPAHFIAPSADAESVSMPSIIAVAPRISRVSAVSTPSVTAAPARQPEPAERVAVIRTQGPGKAALTVDARNSAASAVMSIASPSCAGTADRRNRSGARRRSACQTGNPAKNAGASDQNSCEIITPIRREANGNLSPPLPPAPPSPRPPRRGTARRRARPCSPFRPR